MTDETIPAKRRWWIAAILVLLTPVGFLYVGRPRLFFALFLWKLVAFTIVFVGISGVFASPVALLAMAAIDGAVLIITGVATIWLSVSERRYTVSWCNSWPVYAAGSSAALALILAPELPIFNQKVETYTISSTSMAPTILTSDYLVADQRDSVATALKAGDVIIARYAHKDFEPYVHRIIGTPGDKIRLIDGIPEVNGTLLRQELMTSIMAPTSNEADSVEVKREFLPSGRSYLITHTPSLASRWNTEVVKVGDGEYYVLGDNRENSIDSRFGRPQGFGLVAQIEISGIVTGIYWSSEVSRVGKTVGPSE